MPNWIVTGGWGGQLVIPGMGYGAAARRYVCLVRFETGELEIDVETEDGKVYLTYSDGDNDLSIELPFTAEQLSGDAWAIIKVNRVGSNLIVTVDKTELAAIPITKKTYGGVVHFAENRECRLFDPRVRQSAVSKEGSDYYYDDIYENQGNALLPTRG